MCSYGKFSSGMSVALLVWGSWWSVNTDGVSCYFGSGGGLGEYSLCFFLLFLLLFFIFWLVFFYLSNR